MWLRMTEYQLVEPNDEVPCSRRMTNEDKGIVTDDGVLPKDQGVQQIIDQEHKYKRELWRLQKIIRRGMSSNDSLPLFNRRHFLILVMRLYKDLDRSTYMIKDCTEVSKLTEAMQKAIPLSHSLLCIAYADTLHEIREFLKREMSRREDNSICFCNELHAERALLPLHRLKYLKSLNFLSAQTKNTITSALDGSFTAISSLHCQMYVSEIDNLLDFALNMDPPPKLYYAAEKYEPIYQDDTMSFNSKDDPVYEEINPVSQKPKKKYFFISNCIKHNRDISATEDFIPLARLENRLRAIYS